MLRIGPTSEWRRRVVAHRFRTEFQWAVGRPLRDAHRRWGHISWLACPVVGGTSALRREPVAPGAQVVWSAPGL